MWQLNVSTFKDIWISEFVHRESDIGSGTERSHVLVAIDCLTDQQRFDFAIAFVFFIVVMGNCMVFIATNDTLHFGGGLSLTVPEDALGRWR